NSRDRIEHTFEQGGAGVGREQIDGDEQPDLPELCTRELSTPALATPERSEREGAGRGRPGGRSRAALAEGAGAAEGGSGADGEVAAAALAARVPAVAHELGIVGRVGDRLDAAGLADEFVASEVAAAAGMSIAAARTRITAAAALFLTDRLPRTRVLLRAGLL